jgi:hypothetical protein
MNVDEVLKYEPLKPLADSERKRHEQATSSSQQQQARKKFRPYLDHLSERARLEVLKRLELEPEVFVF